MSSPCLLKKLPKKVLTAFTDPSRLYRSQPGHPEICNVNFLHGYFNKERQQECADRCRHADIGCVEHKRILADEINTALAPFRERRAALASRPQYITEVLVEGAERARAIAQQTIAEVKQKMGLITKEMESFVRG